MAFKFSIVNVTWAIEEIPQLDRRLVSDKNETCYGTTHYSDYTIFLSDSMDKQHFMHTLRHEITHAIIYSSVYSKENSEEGYISEEQVCDFMGNWSEFMEQTVKDYLEYKKR
jgi:hypothetical protein